MKDCVHKWESVKSENLWGWQMQDECVHCKCVGELSKTPDENGFYQIVAKPMATVTDLTEYRNRKEQQNGKTSQSI